MAYATGTFTGSDTLTQVHELIRSFAVSNGWTVTNSTYPNLKLNAQECFAHLSFSTSTTVDDSLGATANASSPDHRISLWVAESATGAAVNTVLVNDLTPPYANYWIFSEASGGRKYILLVIQKASGRFCYLHFGNIDKQGATYTSGAFAHGIYWRWWFNSPTLSDGEGSSVSSSNHRWIGKANSASENNATLYLSSGFASDKPQPGGLMTPSLTMGDHDQSLIMGHIFHLGPMPVNSVTPLFDVPLMYRIGGTPVRQQFLGILPGFKFCSMKGRLEAEPISFSTENYIVFPFKRFLPWNPVPWSDKIVTSGPYGFAARINS